MPKWPTAVAKELPSIAAAVEAIAARLRSGGRLIYLGAGTSGRLGALDASECPPTFDMSSDLVIGCIAGGSFALSQAAKISKTARKLVGAISSACMSEADVLVGITASGRTPYVLGAVAALANGRAGRSAWRVMPIHRCMRQAIL